jgi:hypothetical protein
VRAICIEASYELDGLGSVLCGTSPSRFPVPAHSTCTVGEETISPPSDEIRNICASSWNVLN